MTAYPLRLLEFLPGSAAVVYEEPPLAVLACDLQYSGAGLYHARAVSTVTWALGGPALPSLTRYPTSAHNGVCEGHPV